MIAEPSDDVAVAAPAPAPVLVSAPAPKPLEYDKSGGSISRRQMSLLLLFIGINTFLFATFICLPMVFPTLKQEWANWQKDRMEKKQAAKEQADRQAKLDACLNYTAPRDRLVYTEVAAEGEKLLATNARAVRLSGAPGLDGSTTSAMVNAVTESGWRPAVLLPRAVELVEWKKKVSSRTGYSSEPAMLFLHEMRTPSGKQRLVCVELSVSSKLRALREEPEPPIRFNTFAGDFEIFVARFFNASVIDPAKPETELRTILELVEPAEWRCRFSVGEGPDSNRKPTTLLRAARAWRVFAGQVDPADPTRLTIGYEVDGKAGVIDGRLTEGDRLMLSPRVGRLGVWTSSSTYTWDLSPTTAPAK
jgi:hypothetical protein